MAGAPVVVTGIGLVSPHGHRNTAVFEALMRGESAIGITRSPLQIVSPATSLPSAAEPPLATIDFDPSPWMSKLERVGADRVSQMAVAAARLAVEDARLGPWADAERVGVYCGTGMGGIGSIEAGFNARHAGGRMSPLTIPAAMPNACAAHVAMRLGVKGPVITHAVACASGAIAIAEAAHAIARGEIDVAIAGGAESVLTPGSLAAWQALQTLAKPREGDASASCRPFSRDRDGLVLGEGSAFLVIESAAHARRRDRAAYARMAGSAVRCDAQHLTRPHADGQASALRAALAMSGLEPTQVGWCNAHGTATVAGDPVECAALRSVWGGDWRRLSISATKSMHGHLLGAGGALEAAISVMALTAQAVPPTAHVRPQDVDEACEMNHVLGTGVPMPALRAVISNSFAFGGTNAVLVFTAD